MKRAIFAVLPILAILVASPNANAFSLVTGVNKSFVSSSGEISGIKVKQEGGIGYGVGVLWNISKVEMGMIYTSNKVKGTVAGVTISDSASSLNIPVTLQLGNKRFSFGVGGFYDLPISTEASSDYGVVAGPRIYFGKLFLDARFAYGLKSNEIPYDDGAKSIKSKTAIAMFGLRF